jgi:5-methyltetrahydrofolate--homocysteine methyltransferase
MSRRCISPIIKGDFTMLYSIDEIIKGGVFLSDGAWGTELVKRGMKRGEIPELLNETNPDLVREVAESYVRAGSDIILTNTFGGNRILLALHGLETRVEELNRLGVGISREAAAGRALVFASIGPTGKMIIMGDITREAAEEAFREQAAAAAEAGADAIVVETMGDIQEYEAAVRAAKSTGLPVVGCMSFDSGKDKQHTMYGVSVEQMVEMAEHVGIDMVGANCGVGIENYIRIAENLLKTTRLPVWIKPNAGLPEIDGGNTIYRMKPEEFAEYARVLVELGVRVIGGCFGSTPDHIEAARAVIGR